MTAVYLLVSHGNPAPDNEQVPNTKDKDMKQRKPKLRKWADDLKLWEEMLTDKTRELTRAETNIIKLESNITELNNII
jgi:hypothetical protein